MNALDFPFSNSIILPYVTQGLELMREFGDELEEHIKMREQLVLAEKLFDMPLSSYPELGIVESSMKKLTQIYDVYKGHVDSVASYSSMLWSELDINKMTQSTEEVMMSLKKLKHLKTVPTYEMVELTIQGFQNSLPLMADLKSEALRKRHWDQLMAVTGKTFDMDPKTFTLANMFAMHLDQYTEQISEITSAAVKELTIESELKKLAEVWKDQKFSISKYFKVRQECSLCDHLLGCEVSRRLIYIYYIYILSDFGVYTYMYLYTPLPSSANMLTE